MASVNKRPDGRWRARYRDLEGHEHARHFARRVDAERWLDTIRGDLARGTYVDPAAGQITFAEYAEQWRRGQVHRPTTAVQVASNLANHVLPTFGARPLSSVRRSEVQSWVSGRAEVLSPTTVSLIYHYVATIFRAAVEDRLLSTTPCTRIKLPRPDHRRVDPLPTDAIQALVAAVQDRYRALIVLAAGTGLRQGEAFGLTVSRIDFLRRTLRVDRQLILLPGQPPYLAPPKTAASHRTVPLPGIVLEALAAHLAAYPASGEELVFTSPQGRPIRRTAFSSSVWRPAVARAGLPEGAHFHDLRHYYASLLIRHGESVKVVQSRLGHKNASETLDTYSHLWPDSEERTRAAVDSALKIPADYVRTESSG